MDPSKLQKDNIISMITFMRVKEPNQWRYGQKSRIVPCTDVLTGKPITLEGDDLIEECLSADHYSTEIDCTLTQIAQKFVEVGIRPFTVTFTKKNGEARILRGSMLNPDGILGRSTVHDFDVGRDHPVRQVDHRTITSLIVSDVKYTVRREKK